MLKFVLRIPIGVAAFGWTVLTLAAEVALQWAPVDEESVGLYEVRYSAEGSVYDEMVTTASTAVIVQDLLPGFTYWFAVRACTTDQSVCGAYSDEVSTTISGEGDGDSDGDGIADWADPSPSDANAGIAAVWLPDSDAQVDENWAYVNAPSGYLGAVVIAGPPTFHGADPGVVRLRNVSDRGFELRFQEWDNDDRDLGDIHHAREDTPFVVLLPGRYAMSDGSVWEIGTFDVGGTRAWQMTSFAEPFSKPPHLFLTVQTDNDNQAVSVRARNLTAAGFEAALFEEEAFNDGHSAETVGYLAIYSHTGGGVLDLDGERVPYLLQSLAADERWSPVLSHRLKVEEEQSRDPECDHIDETLQVIAIGNQLLAQQVSHNGGDTTALRRLEPTADAPMEWGLIRGIDQDWQVLPFAKIYDDPVVVVKPASSNHGGPGVIRIRKVAATDAQLRYQEWDYLNGNHKPEDVFFLVSEAGEHDLGGLTVEADWLVSNRLGRTGQWESVPFNAQFRVAPVVLASIMTYRGGNAATTRIRNLNLAGMDLAMDEQESKLDWHANETLGWIAVAQGNGTTAEGRNLDAFFEQIDNVLTPVAFSTPTSHRYPTVLADVDSSYGMETVSLCYANPSNAQIELRLTEEQSADKETAHVLEDVGLFVGD